MLYCDGSAKWTDRTLFMTSSGGNKLPATWVPPTGSGWATAVIPYDNNMQQDFYSGATANGTMACLWEMLDRQGGATANPNFILP